MRPHLAAMTDYLDVIAVCNGSAEQVVGALPEDVKFRPIPIERRISPLRDIAALVRLITLFREFRPALVHSITPKAGFLTMVAAYLSAVPVRVHVFTGQVWATKRGFSRIFLRFLDSVTAFLATHVLADSGSQRDYLVSEGVVAPGRISVLADGSIVGVDLSRFRPVAESRARIRKQIDIPDDAFAVLFVGRLTREKGILDLARAFVNSSAGNRNIFLIIVGPDEEGLMPEIERIVALCPSRVRYVGMTAQPEDYMRAADIFALPSYREGFGSVVIEAAACGLPAIASRIYGITDAVVDGVTGMLHTPGDIGSIESALCALVGDGGKRIEMGHAARLRVEKLFSERRVVAAQTAFYKEALGLPKA